MKRIAATPRPNWQNQVEMLGFDFHTFSDGAYWDESSCYQFSANQIDDVDDTVNELHRLCLAAVEHVVTHAHLFDRLGIPPAFVPYIIDSWRRREATLYGRFDLAYDGKSPPKLLEYNADTPTSLLEASLVQWDWLQSVRPGADQFNAIHERLVEAWRRAADQGLGWQNTVHFSAFPIPEDLATTWYLKETAEEAGLNTHFLTIEDIGWNGQSFTDLDEVPILSLFKLYPWEWLVREEFGPHILKKGTRFLEPAWKMILSNKGILPILWELFPDHPNLLPAGFDPKDLPGDYVKKPLLSREGANISIFKEGRECVTSDGLYGEEGYIYQGYCPLPVFDGYHTVIGAWVIGGESAGIGIREDQGPVTTDDARFVPHFFE